MSVTIELDLPEALVKEAKANGLLQSRRNQWLSQKAVASWEK
jgi:hypothetical protein